MVKERLTDEATLPCPPAHGAAAPHAVLGPICLVAMVRATLEAGIPETTDVDRAR